MKKKPKKTGQQPRLPLPAGVERPKRVEKTLYLEPEQARAAEARRRALGISFSHYLALLVRADLQTCK